MEPEPPQRSALSRALPRYDAPSDLRRRVLHAIDRSAVRSWRDALGSIWRAAAMTAAVAAAVAIGFFWGDLHRQRQATLDEAISNHIRALSTGHLADVISTDQHTVKPWFAGKLDFSPPVFDLSADGFPLAAGRLERLGDHTAAALIFHRRQHTLTLYIWPETSASVPEKTTGHAGYYATAWTRGSFAFVAVSDLSPKDLTQFSADYRTKADGP